MTDSHANTQATGSANGAQLEHFPRPAALPYLTVRGARDAITWYGEVFHAQHTKEPYIMSNGKVGHAELDFDGTILYLADEFAELGLLAPVNGRHSVSLMLPVADTDATLARARKTGAHVEREPYEDYGGRNAALIDPFGHRWLLYQPLLTAS